MAKLSDNEVNFIRLVQRSEDTGDGWCNVSKILWRLVEGFGRKELIEYEQFPDVYDHAGRVRLSERGKIVAEYLI